MGPAQGRRALDQLEPVWHEHADKWTLGGVEQPLDGGAVYPIPLRLAGLEPHRQLVRSVVGLAADRHARGVGAEPDHLALVRRPRRAAHRSEVDGLEQIRFPAPFGPHTTVNPGPSVVSTSCSYESCEARRSGPASAEAPGEPPHRGPYTFSLIGMIRY